MIYDKVIEFLSEAIRRDPGNKEAYFDRAVAYFETGSFELALEDYLLADKGKGMPKSTFEATKEFTSALLSLIKKFAGKGKPLNKEIPGNPNYGELIDFGEHIGVWKDKEGIISLPTTKGHIHYSKKGAHIIPANPKSTFGNL